MVAILLLVLEGKGGKGEQKMPQRRRRRGGPLSGWEPKGEEAKKRSLPRLSWKKASTVLIVV